MRFGFAHVNEKILLERCFHFWQLNVNQAAWERIIIWGKYEQSVNMPKNSRKTVIIRKFRQIPAKMELESQCLRGVPEGTVEMKEARLGRWHLSSDWASSTITMVRRNERSPFRALTHGLKVLKLLFGFVEMKEARLGRWHNNSSHLPSEYFL